MKFHTTEGVEEFVVGTIKKLEDFIKDHNLDKSHVELLQDNVILYRCDVKNACGSLSILANIREYWACNKFDYSKLCTKEEIKEYLQKDYVVAVKGLKEIDLNDLEKLDESTYINTEQMDYNNEAQKINDEEEDEEER